MKSINTLRRLVAVMSAVSIALALLLGAGCGQKTKWPEAPIPDKEATFHIPRERLRQYECQPRPPVAREGLRAAAVSTRLDVPIRLHHGGYSTRR